MQIILTPEEEKLYNDCINIYGADAQLEQYLEECIEAAVVARKFLRAKKNGDIEQINKRRAELISEIVDTTIMSTQMKKIMCDDDSFDREWEFKINRQIKRVTEKQHIS